MAIRKPYLIFLGDVATPALAKTAFGVRDWARQDCLAQWRSPSCQVDLGLPDMEPAAARAGGARSLLIGIAPAGGRLPASWIPALLRAAQCGLDIVSGLHTRLEEIEGLSETAKRHGVNLVNVRTPAQKLPTGTGIKRTGKRLLTVGTDCAQGKKYTALRLTHALQENGISAHFRATGQTGILIAGTGVPLDAVVADFIAGAAEMLTPDAAPEHWDVIEGQGSLFHPAYAGVTLGLVHGSQPDALVLCHDPARTHIRDAPHVRIPPLPLVADRYLEAARLTNPRATLVGISLNTSTLTDAARAEIIETTARDLGVPCFDPMQTSAEPVIARMAAI